MVMALSYSRISDYRTCPLKFKGKYIEKWPNMLMKDEDKSPALVRGGNIHKQLDNYVKAKNRGETPQLTMPEVVATAPLIDKIMDSYNVMGERQIAIDDNFKEVSWFSKQSYFRVIYDLVGFGPDLLLVDWKTGKLADYSGSMDELGQLHFGALVGMTLWPEYMECTSLYSYVDHGKNIPAKFDRDDLEPMKEKLILEHRQINEEQDWLPKKNRFCWFCDAIKEQCNFSTKY